MEESQLIQAAQRLDLAAFNELVLKYQNQVFHHALSLLRNQELAEDITQEAFILAFRKLHQFRGDSFRAWLFKIATNLCYSEMRTWKREPLELLEPANEEGETNESPYWLRDSTPGPEEAAEMGELHEKLEAVLNKLPEIYRNVVSLIDIQKLDYKETASVLGVSIGTIKSRLARGRMQFRMILKNMDTNVYIEKNIYKPNNNVITAPSTKGISHNSTIACHN
jgi:RNA polymerase sigma-70 factor (ECF subfamily)